VTQQQPTPTHLVLSLLKNSLREIERLTPPEVIDRRPGCSRDRGQHSHSELWESLAKLSD